MSKNLSDDEAKQARQNNIAVAVSVVIIVIMMLFAYFTFMS